MEILAILALETTKPIIYIVGELGRFFTFPFTSIIREGLAEKTEKIFLPFEKRTNIGKLINILEDKTKEKEKPKSDIAPEQASTETTMPQKKGWRRYLQF